MIRVELIYDNECPNWMYARTNLLKAFQVVGIQPKWKEWDRSNPETPAHARAYGSPTILVNGQDIADVSSSEGANCCRIYVDQNGKYIGIPTVESITSALLKVKCAGTVTGTDIKQLNSLRSSFGVLPGIGIALLPKVVCPACWPAYAGFLSSIGIGFVNYTPYLLPLTTIFLILAVVSLWYRAGTRRGYRPFILGIFAATIVLVGKFVFFSDSTMYGGIVLLMSASLWNSWPKRITCTCSQ